MKSIKKLVKTVISIIFILCSTTFMACLPSYEPTTREDVIPETLGEREGLYLYYNNYRSFTDGTQTERLVNDITVDGVTYTTDEYYVEQAKYVTNKKEIIYSITAEKYDEYKFFLWHYNYDTKESGLIRTFANHIIISISEQYIFARSRDPRTDTYLEGILYDHDLNFVQDKLGEYQLNNDMLYSYDGLFKWYKNGNFFQVAISGAKSWPNQLTFNGSYAYIFPEHCIYAINLDTGEYTKTNYHSGESIFVHSNDYGKAVTSGENLYSISYTKLTEGKWEKFPLHTGCYLWRMNKLNAERIYTFPSHLEVEFSTDFDDNHLNLDTTYAVKYPFDNNVTEKRGIAYFEVRQNRIILEKHKEIPKEIEENFRIGEYEFYVDYDTYGALLFPDKCYYLHRVKDGKDEILQYFFEEDPYDLNPLKFDDIYTK